MKFLSKFMEMVGSLVNPKVEPALNAQLNRATEAFAALRDGAEGAADQVKALDSALRCNMHLLADPDLVKRKFPKSAFTKKGPGVLATVRETLLDMEPWQRAVAHSKGWDRGMCDHYGRMVR